MGVEEWVWGVLVVAVGGLLLLVLPVWKGFSWLWVCGFGDGGGGGGGGSFGFGFGLWGGKSGFEVGVCGVLVVAVGGLLLLVLPVWMC